MVLIADCCVLDVSRPPMHRTRLAFDADFRPRLRYTCMWRLYPLPETGILPYQRQRGHPSGAPAGLYNANNQLKAMIARFIRFMGLVSESRSVDISHDSTRVQWNLLLLVDLGQRHMDCSPNHLAYAVSLCGWLRAAQTH